MQAKELWWARNARQKETKGKYTPGKDRRSFVTRRSRLGGKVVVEFCWGEVDLLLHRRRTGLGGCQKKAALMFDRKAFIL